MKDTHPEMRRHDMPPWHARRPRLLTTMNETESRLIVLQAGRGFGKSMLISDWMVSQPEERALVWVPLDSTITSPELFWDLVLAVAGFDDSETPVNEERQPGWQRAYGNLRRSTRPVTVVFDGGERLALAGVREEVARILRLAPDLRLVVASRTPGVVEALDPDRYLDAAVIDEEALAFTLDEIRAAAAARRLSLTDERIHSLFEETAGWPHAVGLVLREIEAGGSVRATGLRVQSSLRAALRAVSDAQPTRVLLTVAALGRGDAARALAVGVPAEQWEDATASLELAGFGWWSSTEHGHFRVSPIVQRAARVELEATHPGDLKTIDSRISRHLSRTGEHAGAFLAALDAEEWDLAERILIRNYALIVAAFMDSQPIMPHRRFSARKNMFLAVYAGVEQYAHGRHFAAARHFATVITLAEAQRFTDQGRPSAERVLAQGFLLIGARLSGLYPVVPRALDRFLALLARADDPHHDLSFLDEIIEVQTATTTLYLGDTQAARSLLAGSVRWKDDGEIDSTTFHRLSLRALVEVADGDHAAARATLRLLWSVSTPERLLNSFYAVPAHTAEAILAIERVDLDDAGAELDATRAHWATMEHWPITLAVRVRLTWKKHGAAAALGLLDDGTRQKKHRPNISPFLNATLTALRLDLLLAELRNAEAEALAQAEQGSRYAPLAAAILRVHLVQGRFAEALSGAIKLHQSGDAGHSDAIGLLLIAASASLRLAEESTALDYFQSALRISRRTEQIDPFAFMVRDDFLRLSAMDAREEAHTAWLATVVETVAQQSAYVTLEHPRIGLTRRERIVLSHLATDHTLAEIAAELNVSVNTVRNQTASIYRKLGVTRREDAVPAARRARML